MKKSGERTEISAGAIHDAREALKVLYRGWKLNQWPREIVEHTTEPDVTVVAMALEKSCKEGRRVGYKSGYKEGRCQGRADQRNHE